MNRILRIILTMIIIVAVAYGIWWQLSQNKTQQEEQLELATAQSGTVPVRVVTADTAMVQQSFTVNGTFEPAQELVVVSTVSGQIIEANIRPGSYVKKGDVMLVVDNTYTQNELDATRLQLDKAEKDVNRMKNLIGEGGVTQAQFEEANVKLEGAKIQIQSLEKRLKDAFIKAPISGTITLLPRTQEPMVGAFLGQGKPVCQIVNVGQMRLKVQLTEEQIIQVRKGMKVSAIAEVFPEADFEGTVTMVGVKSEILSKRYPVEILINNSRMFPLKGGMSGRSLFTFGEIELPLAIPRKAFVGSVRQGEVYVLEKDRAYLRMVKIGRQLGDQIEILGGLKNGDQVVVSGQINLEDDTPVNIVQ